MHLPGMKILTFSLCLGFELVHGAVVFGFGGCPSVTSKSDFIAATYLGVWYEHERFNNWFERGLKCVSAQYSDDGGGVIGVRNEGIKIRTGELQSITGTATVPDSNKPGELKVSFSNFDFTRGANYIILDTDYTSYALVFSCTNVPLVPVTFQTAWILTRVQEVTLPNLETLKDTLDSYGIPSNRLKKIDQDGCSD